MGQNAVSQYRRIKVDFFFFFLPADKQESFLQSDSVTLGVRSQACTKYLKQVYNIVTISQGKHEG